MEGRFEGLIIWFSHRWGGSLDVRFPISSFRFLPVPKPFLPRHVSPSLTCSIRVLILRFRKHLPTNQPLISLRFNFVNLLTVFLLTVSLMSWLFPEDDGPTAQMDVIRLSD